MIELSVHLLHFQGLNEEGLFRIPGSLVKIKKLKNAINAWFVNIASCSDLDNNSAQRQPGHSSIIALYDLFKNIVGHKYLHSQIDSTVDGHSIASKDDLTLTQGNVHQDQQMTFDVHSVAGLLKLYLRELPEPLFTHSLYDQWISASNIQSSSTECRLNAFTKVIEQLPRENYENLRHLIRFLHLLASHQEHNKMTATNLAIATAPSLMWSKPTTPTTPTSINDLQSSNPMGETDDAMSALNSQMASIGMSASVHALVLEFLINNAEQLLPGLVDFNLPGFSDLTTSDNKSFQRTRSIKSASPTGLSTTSSSSFSSNLSNSSVNKTHSRKGGSMEGLLGNPSSDCVPFNRGTDARDSRPQSVHIECDEHSSSLRKQKPPPMPPVPAARSHMKVKSVSRDLDNAQRTTQKPPAPPVPPISREIHRDRRQGIATSGAQSDQSQDPKPRAASLRGTGTITAIQVCSSSSVSNSANLKATRPCVPPPERPIKSSSNDLAISSENCDMTHLKSGSKSEDGDSKSGYSVTSSGNLRGEFEEISAADVEGADISAPISPVVSLDSISGDDSSFDNDNHSLECSWNECGLSSENKEVRPVGDQLESTSGTVRAAARTYAASTTVQKNQSNPNVIGRSTTTAAMSSEQASSTCTTVENTLGDQLGQASLVKPPRSTSPKMTQSTPL